MAEPFGCDICLAPVSSGRNFCRACTEVMPLCLGCKEPHPGWELGPDGQCRACRRYDEEGDGRGGDTPAGPGLGVSYSGVRRYG